MAQNQILTGHYEEEEARHEGVSSVEEETCSTFCLHSSATDNSISEAEPLVLSHQSQARPEVEDQLVEEEIDGGSSSRQESPPPPVIVLRTEMEIAQQNRAFDGRHHQDHEDNEKEAKDVV